MRVLGGNSGARSAAWAGGAKTDKKARTKTTERLCIHMDPFRPVLFVWLAAISLLGAGCITGAPTDANILALEYTLTPPPNNEDSASPGHHCGVASIRGDVLRVQEHAHKKANETGRFLYIDPELDGFAPTLGSSPFVMGFPAKVDAGIGNIDGPWTVIDVDGEGIVRVDGTPVSLPHSWTAEQDGWRMDAVLSEGPSKVQVIPDQMCM